MSNAFYHFYFFLVDFFPGIGSIYNLPHTKVSAEYREEMSENMLNSDEAE